jgi:hypothetical protein
MNPVNPVERGYQVGEKRGLDNVKVLHGLDGEMVST